MSNIKQEDILLIVDRLNKASCILDDISKLDNLTRIDISELKSKTSNIALISEILRNTLSHFDNAESIISEMESQPDYRRLFDLKWETRELSRKGKISADGSYWRHFEKRIDELLDRCPVKKLTRVKRKRKKYASRDDVRERLSAKGLSEQEIADVLSA